MVMYALANNYLLMREHQRSLADVSSSSPFSFVPCYVLPRNPLDLESHDARTTLRSRFFSLSCALRSEWHGITRLSVSTATVWPTSAAVSLDKNPHPKTACNCRPLFSFLVYICLYTGMDRWGLCFPCSLPTSLPVPVSS